MGKYKVDKEVFDVEKFHAALDAARVSRGLLWADVGNEVGIHPSTLTRLSQGDLPNVYYIVLLLNWASLDFHDYVKVKNKGGYSYNYEPLSGISDILYEDKRLSDESKMALTTLFRVLYAESLRSQSG